LAGLIRWDAEPGPTWHAGAYVLTDAGKALFDVSESVSQSVSDSVSPVSNP
jgi:hypothetical protein